MPDELDKAIDELGTEQKTEPQTEVEPENEIEEQTDTQPEENQEEEPEQDTLPEVTPDVTPADLFNLLKEIQKQIEGLSSIPATKEPETETAQEEEQPAEQDGLSLAEELGLI